VKVSAVIERNVFFNPNMLIGTVTEMELLSEELQRWRWPRRENGEPGD
jgi:outer membrane lipopolysaccharide assembly protein LptE/RlpB